MELRIKKAGLEDIELLMQWRMKVLREVFSLDPTLPTEKLEEENRRYYQRTLALGEHIACFACIKDIPVGCGGICLYQEMPSPDNPSGKCAYLMNIYTHPSYRKQGVGKAMLQWLVGQAQKLGTTKIYLETSEAGKPLYQKAGFVPMEDMLKLPPPK